jgi:hypothetical protein
MPVIETNSDGQAVNPSGVYRHPDSGEELVFQATGKFGNPGADAAVRLGFVYLGEADPEKVESFVDPSVGPTAETSSTLKSVAELETELALARGKLAAAEKAASAQSSLVKKGAK